MSKKIFLLLVLGSVFSFTPGIAAEDKKEAEAAPAGVAKKEKMEAATAPVKQAAAQSSTPIALTEEGIKELETRKVSMEAKERELEERARSLDIQEKILKEKLKKMEELNGKMAERLEKYKKEHEERVSKVVTVVEGMKPQSAAEYLENLDPQLAVEILSRINVKNASKILNLVDKKKGARLSELYTGYRDTMPMEEKKPEAQKEVPNNSQKM